MNKSAHHRHSKKRARRRLTTPGTAPGTISQDPCASETSIQVISFSNNAFLERKIDQVAELSEVIRQFPVNWIDVTGLSNVDKIRGLGDLLGLHPLALEDVVNVHQRAKVDAFDSNLFIVARMIDGHDANVSEQISFFLMPGVLVSFQERPGDCWDPVRNRIRQRRGKINALGPDYLLYALLDSIVDSYFPVMDRISDSVDSLEEKITVAAKPEQMREVHELRGQLLSLRRAIRPHREMMNELNHNGTDLISSETHVFLRDCYDHVVQVIDSVDTYRELTSDLRDYYLSMVSNSMNQVMKLLTIISTIFIPLSFVAGVYGMNFDTKSPWNMPELGWEYGYPFALSMMLAIGLFLLWIFRRRQWL